MRRGSRRHPYNPGFSRARARARTHEFNVPKEIELHCKAPAKTQPAAAAPPRGRRIQVRRSGVHGKGVFALQPIAEGETIIEYTGEVITWKRGAAPPSARPERPEPHLLLPHRRQARHRRRASAATRRAGSTTPASPNCEADETDGRVFIKALRDIEPGEELNYDYGLIIDERYTPKLKKQFACRCGSTRLPRHDAGAQALSNAPRMHRRQPSAAGAPRRCGSSSSRCCRACASRWWRAPTRPTRSCSSARASLQPTADAPAQVRRSVESAPSAAAPATRSRACWSPSTRPAAAAASAALWQSAPGASLTFSLALPLDAARLVGPVARGRRRAGRGARAAPTGGAAHRPEVAERPVAARRRRRQRRASSAAC